MHVALALALAPAGIACCFAIARLAALLHSCVRARRLLLSSPIPGPPLPSILPIGHVPALLGPRNAWTVAAWVAQYGQLVLFQLLSVLVVLVSDPATIQRVTRTTGPGPYLPKPHDMYKMLEASCSPPRPSLISSPDGGYHRAVRQATAPCFSVSNMKKVVPLVLELTQRVAARMAAGGGVFDITDGAKRITSDVMGHLLLGEDLGGTRWMHSEYLDVFYTVLKAQACMVSNPLYLHMVWHGEVRLARRCMADHNRLMAAAVRRLRAHPPAQHTIAAHILAALDPATGQPLDDLQVKAEISTFMAAGFETTSHAITWCVAMLAAHPAVQEQVFEELQGAGLAASAAGPGRVFEAADWGRLPLLAAVIKETLRLCPPVPFGGCRHVTAHSGADLCGFHVPQATVVMFPLLAIGNSKAVYGPDARDFNPQRWLRQQRGVESQQPGAAVVQPAPLAAAAAPPEPLTFMAGPRDCIGQNLAKLELQVVLATLLGRFRFGPGPELAQELAVAAATGQPPVAALHALAGVHITLQPLSGRMEFSVTPRARPDVLNE